MSIFYKESLRENKKPTFKTDDRVQISKYDLLFSKGYKPQFTQENFEIVAIATRKLPTDSIKDEQGEIFPEKFYQEELIKVI